MRTLYLFSACILTVAACETPTGLCPASSVLTLSVDVPQSGELIPGECADPDANPGDPYQVVTTSPLRAQFTLTTTAFEGALSLWSGDFTSDHATQLYIGPSPVNVVLPAGTYGVFVTSVNPSRNHGSYTLTRAAGPLDGCTIYWTTPGFTINGRLTPDDCIPEPDGRGDQYNMMLRKGQAVALHLSGDIGGGFGVVGDQVDIFRFPVGQSGADISFTAPTDGLYMIFVGFRPFRCACAIGYSITIQ
jgi:hypothetical protein